VGNRTPDLLFTRELLYQLSVYGEPARTRVRSDFRAYERNYEENANTVTWLRMIQAISSCVAKLA
jgi:hypothetical protein